MNFRSFLSKHVFLALSPFSAVPLYLVSPVGAPLLILPGHGASVASRGLFFRPLKVFFSLLVTQLGLQQNMAT